MLIKENYLFLTILFTLPLLFSISILHFAINQKFYIRNLPNVIPKYSNNPSHPPFPKKDLLQSFKCGILMQKYKSSKKKKKKKQIQIKITKLLNWHKLIKPKEILEMQKNTEIFIKNKSWSKVLKIQSFINIIWIISIFGLTISIFFLSKDLIYILTLKIFKIIYPLRNILKFLLHPFLYFISLSLIVQGKRYKNTDYIGFFICLTGLCISFLSFLYGIYLSEPYKNFNNNYKDKLLKFLLRKYLVLLICLTFVFESKFFGFFSVVIFFSLLGFVFLPLGLCWVFGWEKRDHMGISIFISFFLIQINIFFKYFPELFIYTKYFSLGFSVMGSIVCFLGLLIKSSGFNSFDYERQYYLKNNLFFVFLIFEVLFFGCILNLDSMVNTSLVFIVLFFFEKFVELNGFYKIFQSIWWFMFFLFGFLWCFSYFISTHPSFIMKIFE